MHPSHSILVCMAASALALGWMTGDAAAANPSYAGKTSQRLKLTMSSTSQGVRFVLAWTAACGDGGAPFAGTTSNSVALRTRRNGSFSHREAVSARAADGARVRYDVSVSGKVRKTKVTGSWRLMVAGDYVGAGRYSCTTGKVRWSARRRAAKRTRVSARAAASKLGLTTKTRSPGKRPNPGPRGGDVASGRVVFDQKDCTAGPVVRRLGLSSATIRFVSSTTAARVDAPLDSTGRFANVKLPAGNDFHAFAVTDGPRVRVAPELSPVQPYAIPLGRLTELTPTFTVPPGPASGAANLQWTLDRGAAASPVAIPRVTALWRYRPDLTGWIGDRDGSATDDTARTIYVGGHANGTRRDEWERYPILHEYAHVVLDVVASPGPNAAGPHSADTVSPANPALAWSEGFANAYAAIVEGSGQLTLGCTTRVDFDAAPATYRGPNDAALTAMPRRADRHLAQYNETAIGAVVLGVARRLGGGQASAGLPKLLTALTAYSRAHAGPVSVREFRDALIEDGTIETTALAHQEISELFQGQRIQWGIHVSASDKSGDDLGVSEIQARLQGPPGSPYANCAVADEFPTPPLAVDYGDSPVGFHPTHGISMRALGSRGGIAYAWQDDCYADTDGDPDDVYVGSGDGEVEVPFPYAAGSVSGHDPGKLTVSHRFTCASRQVFPPCPPSQSVVINIFAGAPYWHPGYGTNRPLGPLLELRELGAVYHETPLVTLPRNQWVDVARFDAAGHCESLVDGFDCSR